MLIEPNHARADGDCAITALSRALGVPYETALSLAGNPPLNEGITPNELIAPLWKAGIAAVHLISTVHPRAGEIGKHKLPESDAILAALHGYPAIVRLLRYCVCGKAEIDHYFAWDGQRLIHDLWVSHDGFLFQPSNEPTCLLGPIIDAIVLPHCARPHATERIGANSHARA